VSKITKGFSFIDSFEDLFRHSTDAPLPYAKVLGVQILGHAMGHDCVNRIQPGEVFHNMYSLLIGVSTKTRKSTAQDLANVVYGLEYNNASTTGSPERFITDLSENPNLFWWMPEYSWLLKSIKGGGYASTYAEILNDLHRCPQKYSRKLQKKKDDKYEFIVENAYLDVCSTITPEVMAEHLNIEIAFGGLLPRFLLVNGKPDPKPRKRLPRRAAELKRICVDMVKAIRGMTKTTPFVLDDEALKRYNEIEVECYRRENIDPFVGRYLNYTVAIADILLVSDALGAAVEQGISPYKFSNLVDLLLLVPLVRLVKIDDRDCLVDILTNYTNINNITNLSKDTKIEPIQLSGEEYITVPVRYVDAAYKIIKPCLDTVEDLIQDIGVNRNITKVKKIIKNRYPDSIPYNLALQCSGLLSRDFEAAYQTLIDSRLIKLNTPERESPMYKCSFIWVGNRENG